MAWLIVAWNAVSTASRPLGKVISRLREIPVIDDAVGRLHMGLLNPVVVRRVRVTTDPDLHAALDLYEKRIRGELRFQSSDIIHWLSEDAKVRSKDEQSPHDFFVVAKFKRMVRGFVLFHYYPTRRIAFFAYMVVDRNTAGLSTNHLSNTLIGWVKERLSKDKQLRLCETLLFEVEDPRKSPREKQLEDIARIQRFCSLAESQGFSLRSYEFNYRQPHLTIPNEGNVADEQPLLLLSAKARSGQQNKEELREEVKELLSFIYLDLYPEGFSPIQEEDDAYRAYCKRLYDEAVAGLPEKIKVINPAHLTCGRKVRRASKSQQSRKTD